MSTFNLKNKIIIRNKLGTESNLYVNALLING